MGDIENENQIKQEQNKKQPSPNKHGGNKNWRGRGGSGRGRGFGRGDHGGQQKSEVKRESALNYYPNGEPVEGNQNEHKWNKNRGKYRARDSEQDGERGSGITGPRTMTIEEKINFQTGPTYDLPPVSTAEKKFNGRNRLYIANTGPEVTEEEIKSLFEPYGETNHIFINKEKNFSFVTFGFHANALRAKNDLDGKHFKGRNLKIRFSSTNATIKVKNLSAMVSNELLYHAFSPFGEIDEAKVSVDQYGKPIGEGLVHFTRKSAAITAVSKCCEGCYFLTTSLQPVIAELYDVVDGIEGYPDKAINKKNQEFAKERELGPRFAKPDSFEFEYGQRWKNLLEHFAQKEKALKIELQLEKEKLVAQMEFAKYENETEMLRNTLRARELDKERQKRELELKQKQVEEEQTRSAEAMRRYQQELESKIARQQGDMWRTQQENNLFRQAHNLDNLLDQTERDLESRFEENNVNDGQTFEFSKRVKQERPGHWVNENVDEGFYGILKRRRF